MECYCSCQIINNGQHHYTFDCYTSGDASFVICKNAPPQWLATSMFILPVPLVQPYCCRTVECFFVGNGKLKNMETSVCYRSRHDPAVLGLPRRIRDVLLHRCGRAGRLLCHLHLVPDCQENCPALHRLQRPPERRNVHTRSVSELCTNELLRSKQ